MDFLKIFPQTTRINEKGHLEIGGVDAVELAGELGTPLYVYDELHLRQQLRRYVEAFREEGVEARVAYAGKAFLCRAMAQLVAQEGCWLDVASGGEIYTALSAGFPPEKMFFHGNNKTPQEVELALDAGIGYIVLDSFDEIELVEQMASRKGCRQKVLIRVTPGIVPRTHSYIQTGRVDSKFGFSYSTGLAMEAVVEVLKQDRLELVGFHMHIGSQIFSVEPFELAVDVMEEFVRSVHARTGFYPELLNFGGGVGVAYRVADSPPAPEEFVRAVAGRAREKFDPLPVLAIEPGRSVAANACVSLYTIGTRKEIPGLKYYISVDGGMSDNLRPALYGAVYEAYLANRMNEQPSTRVAVAGKHCENGDILIREAELPAPQKGDILAIPVTGAYGYSMANNYNRQPRPAVVFVRDGKARVVVERESYDDLVRLDRGL